MAKDDFEEQTEDLYAAIGRFAVEFEHICNYMRIIIMSILAKEGLSNDNVMEILLSDLNAEPLRALVLPLIVETKKLSDNDRRIVNEILNKVQALTKRRNEVIHGTWYIGWASIENEYKVAPGVKLKKNKSGVATEQYNWTAEEFNKLADDANYLWGLLAKLSGCIVGDYEVENNFIVDGDGRIVSVNEMYK